MNSAGIVAGGCCPDDPLDTRFPRPVDVEVDCGVWDLRASPEMLTRAARAWREHGDSTSGAAEEIHRSCRELLDSEHLKGDLAERFDTFQSELIAKLDQYEGVAERVAEQLDDASASLRTHQETLDGLRADILAKVPGRETNRGDSPPGPRPPVMSGGPVAPQVTGCVAPPPTHIVFQASSFQDLRAIEDAKDEAKQVRAEVDRVNAEVHKKLDEIARDLGMMGRDLVPWHGCGTAEVNNRDRRLPGGFTAG